jgi:signal transduction histidine kinase
VDILGINPIALAGVFVALSTAVLTGAMFTLGREYQHYLWGIFCLSVSIWSICFFPIAQTSSPDSAVFWWKISHVGVIFIPVTFLHFSLAFVGKHKSGVVLVLYSVAFLFVLINLVSTLIINEVRFVFDQFYYDSPPGTLYPLLTLYFVALITYAHALVYRAFRESNDQLFILRAKYFFFSTSVGFFCGALTFLPVYNIDLYPISILGVAVAPTMIGFAILRYRLFDIRVVSAQFLTLLLAGFAVFRLVISETHSEYIFNGVLLLLTVVTGVYLIRSVDHEVEQREEIERLSQEKSEFMTFASHEIRNPITAMRGLASLIVDGTTGEVSKDTKDTAQKILVAGHDVLNIIATYLSKSKMELGQIKYDKATFDLGEAVNLIAEGYVPHAEVKGLSFVRNIDLTHKYLMSGDQGKVKEVVGNLIDNSLKYTREGGITVSVERHGPFVRAIVSDTGVGIPKETIPHLFKKFARADAQKVNILGTGIGLYLGKTFIEAQGGRIWAESEGEGKGSQFIIEFPAA